MMVIMTLVMMDNRHLWSNEYVLGIMLRSLYKSSQLILTISFDIDPLIPFHREEKQTEWLREMAKVMHNSFCLQTLNYFVFCDPKLLSPSSHRIHCLETKQNKTQTSTHYSKPMISQYPPMTIPSAPSDLAPTLQQKGYPFTDRFGIVYLVDEIASPAPLGSFAGTVLPNPSSFKAHGPSRKPSHCITFGWTPLKISILHLICF